VRPPPTFPRFRPVADHALLVEFGETISAEAHDRVLRLDAALARSPFAGLRESAPAYVSVLVEFDVNVTDHATAQAAVEALLVDAVSAPKSSAMREILVCYDSDLGPDLPRVAAETRLSIDAVIAAHLSAEYGVFMYGFAPGYAYLAGVPGPIQLPRKAAAVRGVAAGSVLIAGPQCLVTTLTMPTGWWIIGCSPTRILTTDESRPFLFNVGDRVRFKRIGRAEFYALEQA
jgi:inhibitor of KinA